MSHDLPPGPDAMLAGLDDEALLSRLAGLLARVDAPPQWLVDLARLSYQLRSIDADLAELVADSLVDQPVVAVRSPAAGSEPRLLSFEAGELLIDLQLTPGRDGYDLVGQLVPAQRARFVLRQPGGPDREVRSDAEGRFTLDLLAAGPFSLVCHRPDARPVASQWVITA